MTSNFITAICFLVALYIVLDAKPYTPPNKKLVYINYTQDGFGNYNFSYNDTNVIASRAEMGKIENSESGTANLQVKGSYENTFEYGDCQTIVVTYNADKNGYRAKFSYEEKGRKTGEMFITRCKYKYKSAVPMGRNISGACVSCLAGGGLG